MKFRVRGADRRTGRDVAREYDAKTPESAAAFANLDGLMVAEVELVSGGANDATPSAATVETLSYRTPTTGSVHVPTYAGLSVASVVLRIYAVICYTLGAAAFALTIVAIVASYPSPGRLVAAPSGLWTLAASLMPTFMLLFAAGVTHGLSAACVALRDIARNSWR